jgi:hypothetical protein
MHRSIVTPDLAHVLGAFLRAPGRAPRPYVQGPVLLVQVRNGLAPPTAVAVWLLPERRPRRLLGEVGPASERLLQTGGTGRAARYRLLADHPWDADVTSGPFVVRGDAVVAWDLAANAVTVLGPRAADSSAVARSPAPRPAR